MALGMNAALNALRQAETVAERDLGNIRNAIASLMGSSTGKRGPGRPKGSGKKRKPMSKAARAKIAAAQKARWAKQKAGAAKK
jgi:hypothetical protein